jgi:hypothetical protein
MMLGSQEAQQQQQQQQTQQQQQQQAQQQHQQQQQQTVPLSFGTDYEGSLPYRSDDLSLQMGGGMPVPHRDLSISDSMKSNCKRNHHHVSAKENDTTLEEDTDYRHTMPDNEHKPQQQQQQQQQLDPPPHGVKKSRTDDPHRNHIREDETSSSITAPSTSETPKQKQPTDSYVDVDMLDPSTRSIPPGKDGISTIEEHDVLAGRGGGTNIHPGNRDFR